MPEGGKRRATTAITINDTDPGNVFPPFILGSASMALGTKVVLFCTPGGDAPSMVKGKLEEMQDVKGSPNLIELYNDFITLGGIIMICENALAAKDLKKEDFREGVTLCGATTFMKEIQDATTTFSFWAQR